MIDFNKHYTAFARRLSEICGQSVSSEQLRAFEEPKGKATKYFSVNPKLSGWSFSRNIGKGERFGVTFRLDVVPMQPEITPFKKAEYVEAQEMYDNEQRSNVVLEALNTLVSIFESPKGASIAGNGRISYNVTGLE